MNPILGHNTYIGENVTFGENVIIKNNCIIEDNVVIGSNVYIDNNVIIRSYVNIGSDSNIGANCILGEYQIDFYQTHEINKHELIIGERATIRSGSVIYSGTTIGNDFTTGHNIIVRENNIIKNNVGIGNHSDIQRGCILGNYVKLNSNVIMELAHIDDFVWIFPNVVLPTDPAPPSTNIVGCRIRSFAVVATNVTILPGVDIGNDALIGAGAIVTRDVADYSVVVGIPGRVTGDVRKLKDRNGEIHYPWRYHFDRSMPWRDVGFDAWYNNLNEEDSKLLFSKESLSE